MKATTIPSPLTEPTLSLADAATLLDVSKATRYLNIADVRHVSIGDSIRVPTAGLLKELGLRPAPVEG